jgi:hypothetical protein
VDEGFFIFNTEERGHKTESKTFVDRPSPSVKRKKEARMKKITAKIKNVWRKAISLLVPDVLPVLAGLLDTRSALCPILVRVEHIYRHKYCF